MKTLSVRTWLLFAVIAALAPTQAYADEPKVYFEKECLALFSAHRTPAQLADNETKVEETQGMIRFEKVVVTETRDGAAETYIQVRNCRTLEQASH